MNTIWRRSLGVLMLAAIGASLIPAIASAQQAGPTLEVRIGMRGWVDPTESTTAIVDVSSPELFSGRLDITASRVVSTAVEIPAGGVKRYIVDVPPVGTSLRAIVSLIPDGASKASASQRITLSAPSREVLVGLLGVDGVVPALRAATSTPTGRAISPIELEATDLTAGASPLGYLIVGSGALDDFDESAIDELEKWVMDGGRIFGPADQVEVFGPAGGDPIPGTTALARRLGEGEVGVLADPVVLDAAVWSSLVRDVEPVGLVIDYTKEELPFQLFSAATAGREASVPGLPWLLGGILVFSVLVGPANFLVLRAMGKPERAWLTVPLLSVVFVAGFWLVGRQAAIDISVTHAMVIADEGGATSGVGAVTVQTSTGGARVLELPGPWSATSLSVDGSAQGIDSRPTGDGRTEVEFTLEDLGLGAVQVAWEDDSTVAIDGIVTPTEAGVSVEITNNTGWEFWAWGIVVGGRGTIASEGLAAGATASQSAVGARPGIDISYEPVVSEAVFRRGFPAFVESPDTRYETVYGLGRYGEELADLRGGGVYFFGFSDEVDFAFEVDGTTVAADGRALVIKELLAAGPQIRGNVRPELIAATGAASIEGYYAEIYAWGAREVFLRYLLPAERPRTGKISPGFTQFDVVELWDWESAEWVATPWNTDIDFSRFASPTGEVMLRTAFSADRGQNNLEESIQLDRYSLQLGAA